MDDSTLVLRDLRPADRGSIAAILSECGVFRPDEVAIALELVDETLNPRPDTDYAWIIAAAADQVIGFACFGPVPMTSGTWDLYWIAVDPTRTRQQIAAQLDRAVTARVRAVVGSRWLLAETSSQPGYAPAHAFYQRQGYDLVGRLADYYRPGDDRLTFGKRLDGDRTDVSD